MLKNIKEEVTSQAKPQVVSILQRYLLCFMIAFISLSLALLILSIRENDKVLESKEIFLKLKEVFGEIIQIKNDFRDLTFVANGIIANQTSLVPERLSYLKYSLKESLSDLQEIANQIKLETSFVDQDLESASEVKMLFMDSKGEVLSQSSSLFQSMNQIYNRVYTYLSFNLQQLKCDGCLMRSQNHSVYSTQQIYQDLFFVITNSIDSLGSKFWLLSQDVRQSIVSDEEEMKLLLIYLVVPGLILSVFGSIYIMLIILKLINNKKKIIQVILKIKQVTAQKAIENSFSGEKQLKRMIFGEVNISQANSISKEDSSGENNLLLIQSQIQTFKSEKTYISQKDSKCSIQNSINISNDEIRNSSFKERNQLQDFIKQTKISDSQEQRVDESLMIINSVDISMQSLDPFPFSQRIKHQDKPHEEKSSQKQQKSLRKAMIQEKIQSSFHQDKMNLVIRLLPITLVFCSFFITQFLLGYSMVSKLEQGVEVAQIITERDNCLSLTFSYVMDDLSQNKTTTDVSFMKMSLQGLIDYCTTMQSEAINLKKNPLSKTFEIEDDLKLMDSEFLCQSIDQELASSGAQKYISKDCSYIMNGLIFKGSTQIYTFILKQYQDTMIQYLSSNKSASSLNSLITREDFEQASLSYSVYFRRGLKAFRRSIHSRLLEYFNLQYQVLLSVFLIFMGIVLIMLVFLLFSVVKFVRKEIFFHKKIIKFIPIAELERKSMSSLLKTFDY